MLKKQNIATAGRGLGRWLKSGPASVVLAFLIFIGPLLPVNGVCVHRFAHHPLSVFPALFWSSGPMVWLVSVCGVLLLGPLAERALGTLRAVALGLTGHIVSTAAVVGLAWVIDDFSPAWSVLLKQERFGGPWMWIICTLMVVSRSWSGMWRRRMLSIVIPVAVTAAAFAGTPFEVGLVAAVGCGWVMSLAGIGVAERPVGARMFVKLAGARSEQRFVIAAAVAAVVFGILVAMGAPFLVGPLAGTRFLVAHMDVDPETLAAVCADATRARVCAHWTFMAASSGPGAIAVASIPLVLQLVLADGLRRGRKAAWTGTVLLQAMFVVLAFAHLMSVTASMAASTTVFPTDAVYIGRLLLPVVVPGGLLLLVAMHRSLFTVETTSGHIRTFKRIVPFTAGVSVALFVGVAVVFSDQFVGEEATFVKILAEGVVLLLPSAVLSVVSPALFPAGPIALTATQLLPLIPWIVVLVLTWKILHAPIQVDPTQNFSTDVCEHATATSTLAWMGTWEGCRVWKAQRAPGAIAFQEHRGVALTVGDPVCDDARLSEVLLEFFEYCESNSLLLAMYSVHEPAAAVARDWGWTLVNVAEETVIPLGSVEFRGKKFQDLRTAQNRAVKEGIEARWTTWDECSLPVQQQIRAVSEEWLGRKDLPEMGFTLGGVDQMMDSHVRLLLAVDENERVHGVTSWMPIYDGGEVVGLTLDFMRRAEGGFRPSMEFLLARAILESQESGMRLLSLSGAPLAHVAHEDAVDDRYGRLLNVLGEVLEPLYGFRSLHFFKTKFAPELHPLYLCVRDAGDLPLVGAALTHAYVPDMSPSDFVRAAALLRPHRSHGDSIEEEAR